MDDPFATDVWSTTEPTFDDKTTDNEDDGGFEDFGPVAGGTDQTILDDDDDFGDFGDADQFEAEFDNQTSTDSFEDNLPVAGPSYGSDYDALRLNPMPIHSLLVEAMDEILAPVWVDNDINSVTTNDPIRETEGIAQVLVTHERCVGYTPCMLSQIMIVFSTAANSSPPSPSQLPQPNPPIGLGPVSAGSSSSRWVFPSTSTRFYLKQAESLFRL